MINVILDDEWFIKLLSYYGVEKEYTELFKHAINLSVYWGPTEEKYKLEKGFFSNYYYENNKDYDTFWKVIYQICLDYSFDFPQYKDYKSKEVKYIEDNGFEEMFV